MSFGWHNPWPFQWGGGTTEIERTYLVLRDAVGQGGSAEDPDSIEQLWRQCKAIGIGSATSSGERAALNAFPKWATDHLEYYEGVLGIVPAPGDEIQTRRERATREWIRQARADMPSLLEELREVAPSVSFIEAPHDEADTTQHGQVFQPRDGSYFFSLTSGFGGERAYTNYPNYSGDFVCRVLYPTTSTGPETLAIVSALARMLHDALPAWNDYAIATSLGFLLDSSPLDLTAFDP